MWIVFPGLACTPEDYFGLLDKRRDAGRTSGPAPQRIGGERVIFVDPWRHSYELSASDLRAALQEEWGTRHPSQCWPQTLKLFGHSFGGLIALEWALDYPEEVEYVVLADPTPPKPTSGRHQGWLTWEQRFWRALPRNGKRFLECAVRWLGPLARLLTMQTLGRGNEPLNRSQRRQRYGEIDSVRLLFRQNLAVQEHQAAAWHRLASQRRVLSARAVVLAGTGGFSGQKFGAKMRNLARELEAQFYALDGCNHLFPLSRSGLVRPFLA